MTTSTAECHRAAVLATSALLLALDALLAGRPVASDQRPSLGCNIKWKAGNEPDYFG